MSLLPERPLLLSPQLAATLGLEEALLYQLLADLHSLGRGERQGGFLWFRVECQQMEALLPFWTAQEIRRISHSLRDKGVLLIGDLPFAIDDEFRFAFNEQAVVAPGFGTGLGTGHGTEGRRREAAQAPLWQQQV